MEARGIETERGAEARRRAQVNAQLAALTAQQEEPEYERARPEPEREPGRAGAEREGDDVGDRARRLAARGGGERGPGLGNGGRARRGAEPERDGELAGRDADPAGAPLRADPRSRGKQSATLGRLIERQEQVLVPWWLSWIRDEWRALILALLVGLLVGGGVTTLYQAFGLPAQELTTYRGMWEAMTAAEKARVNKRIRGEDADK